MDKGGIGSEGERNGGLENIKNIFFLDGGFCLVGLGLLINLFKVESATVRFFVVLWEEF